MGKFEPLPCNKVENHLKTWDVQYDCVFILYIISQSKLWCGEVYCWSPTKTLLCVHYFYCHEWNEMPCLSFDFYLLKYCIDIFGNKWQVLWYALYWHTEVRTNNSSWKNHTFNTLRLRQIATISQTTFSNTFPWMKMSELRFKFHWSLFP